MKHEDDDFNKELACHIDGIKQAFASHDSFNVTMRDAVTQTLMCVPDVGDAMQIRSDAERSVDDQTLAVSMVIMIAADARTLDVAQT